MSYFTNPLYDAAAPGEGAARGGLSRRVSCPGGVEVNLMRGCLINSDGGCKRTSSI